MYKQVMNYVSGCSKTGTNSVVITFRDSFSSNIDALRFPIIPAGYYSGQSDTNTKPVGDDPYEMESYQQASEMKLKASASYYGEYAADFRNSCEDDRRRGNGYQRV